MAVMNGHLEVVKLLLASGADVHAVYVVLNICDVGEFKTDD